MNDFSFSDKIVREENDYILALDIVNSVIIGSTALFFILINKLMCYTLKMPRKFYLLSINT